MDEQHITADLEGANGRDIEEPFESCLEPFEDCLAVSEYADRRGLALAWAGTPAARSWQRTLPPDALEVRTYRSKQGLKTCVLRPRLQSPDG
jgi:hypothetical protein